MHCASLGEFEQGRPLLEKIKTRYPGHRLLLTFFSPSGYEVQKNYTGADWVFYLPMDSARNARRFLEIVHPDLVIFVKYEFWYYYLKKIKYRNIPLLLVSAIFHPNMHFFKWYGVMMRKMLSRFDHLFVQTAASKKLLDDIGMGSNCTVSGDTRFDRVLEIAAASEEIPAVTVFAAQHKTIVAGSTWKEDELLLQRALPFLKARQIQLIIAPHEVNSKNIEELTEQFPEAVLFSALQRTRTEAHPAVLIIDNVGMLSKLYRYSWCSYVGGGLSVTGVHNVLEAAVYGKPVFYGTNYEKYAEAVGLLKTGGGFVVPDEASFETMLAEFLSDTTRYTVAADYAAAFVKNNAGATGIIMQYIQENRLLTS